MKTIRLGGSDTAKKTVTFRVRDYWDGGLVHLSNLRVPSKRVGYKKKDGVLVARVPLGVPEFEDAVRRTFVNPVNDWPMDGRLLVGIGLMMPESEYRKRDVDNMAKSILDAFCGIAYRDDRQIDALYVSKAVDKQWDLWMAFKSLGEDPASWFLEPMMQEVSETASEST